MDSATGVMIIAAYAIENFDTLVMRRIYAALVATSNEWHMHVGNAIRL
jgi:hypothetical protein